MAAIPFSSPIDMLLNEIQNARFQILAADPGAPVEGQFWFNSTSNLLKYYDGTTVIPLGASGTNADTLDSQDGVWYLDRGNHSGAQAQSTITGLVAALALLAPLASPGLIGNPTAPTAAPGDNDVSIATTAFVAAAIAALVGTAPGTLDALGELADALGDDPNFATTIATSLGLKATKYAANVGDGVSTSIVLTHNLNTTDTVVQVKNVSTLKKVMVDIEDTTVNTTTLIFSVAPASNSHRVTILG